MILFRRYYLVLLVLILGVGASFAGFEQFVFIEESAKERSFVLAASDRLAAIEQSIHSNLDSVLSIKSFYESNRIVQRDQFRSFVAPILRRHAAIKALEWIPAVEASRRSEFENKARRDGFKNFKFIERSKSGKLVSARVREKYFPVYFVEPFKGNEGAFGFDLGSSVSRRLALEAARDSGKIATSEAITLIQNGRAGVLIFAPIYKTRQPTDSITLRRKNIAGFALGVVDVQSAVNAAFLTSEGLSVPSGIDFLFYDDDKKIGDPLIYIHQSRTRTTQLSPEQDKKSVQTGLHLTHYLKIGDRNWMIVAKPVKPKFGAGIPQSAWEVFLLGLILSATMAIIVKSNIDRNRDVEALVIERTLELSTKTEQIELMHDVAVIANEADTTEEATQTCIDLICQRGNWQIGHAYFPTTGKEVTLIPSDIWYIEEEERFQSFKDITMRTEFKAGDGLPGIVLAQKKPIWGGKAREENRNLPRKIEARKLGLDSAIGLPVLVEGEVVAVLEFFYAGDFDPDQSLLQSLAHIGAQLGRVFERKKIENMKNEFISTVSHELRTPLTSIKGSLGLIVSGVTGKMSDSISEMVNIAYNNSDRLVRLINDILDIEKIEVGKMEFKMEELELAPLMDRIVAENQGFAKEYNVSLKLNNFAPNAKIRGDSDRVTQAITNLISNAAKFSPDSGIVEIDVTSRETGHHIAISDKGPGISEDFQTKIFGKFAQADSASGQGGTGLGLNISKAIVEQHSGHIGFETELGVGTTFFIDLPKLQEREVKSAISSSNLNEAPRILVCEDDPDIAKLLELMLSKDGVIVDVVYNAAEAKRALLDTSYDAMTLDLGLPDQNGISLLQEIRRQDKTRDLPIVVVSAKAVEGRDELNGRAFGIIDWIQKPIDQNYLHAALMRAIRSGSKNMPRILHIEDDPDVASVVSALIADIATVTLARNYVEGKRLLLSEAFDLVILDLMLPDGAGEELIAIAQGSNEEMPPFIIFSAKEIKSSAMSDNIKAIMVKSRTSNEQLVSTIRAAMENS